MDRPELNTREQYLHRFSDAVYWTTYVRHVADRHGLLYKVVQAPTPGTFPTFVVDKRWVVKFFGTLFEGADSFAIEREANRLICSADAIPAPQLLGEGQLFDTEPHWNYLLFAFCPGTPYLEARDGMDLKQKLSAARWLGRTARAFHRLSLDTDGRLRPTWEPYRAFLQGQRAGCADRHQAAGSLPEYLIEQIDGFLPPTEALFDVSSSPCLVHADLTADHILGRSSSRPWQPEVLIDFGDAMVGDPAYELVALHMDLFQFDKRLLAEFLDAYGWPGSTGESFARKAMSLALLHRFGDLEDLVERFPEATHAQSLDELALWIWNLDERRFA